jgi:hypothetical protein
MLWDTPESPVPAQPRPEATSKDEAADNAETKAKGKDSGKSEGAGKGEAGQGEVGGQGGSAIRSVCQTDVAKFCAGEERVGRCLRRHESELSESCTAALKKQRENQ